ncbi:MAG: nucleoside-diphosphate sugar epimerase/dehydratase [Bacteroidota bacterium]
MDLSIYGISLIQLTIILAFIKLPVFYYFGLYNRIWRSASIDELARIVFAGIFIILIEVFIFYVLGYIHAPLVARFPYSLPLIDGTISISIVAFSRFSVRLFEAMNYRINRESSDINVLIIGAGDAGLLVLNELLHNPTFGKVVGFLDDDKEKHGLKIKGIPVLAGIDNMCSIVQKKKISKIIIAIPTAPGKKIKEIYNKCSNESVELLTIPSIQSIISGKIRTSSIRKVKLEDILRRDAIKMNFDYVRELIREKTVLVSGAGGSIGGEMVRQISSFNPHRIILLGHGENSVFEIEQELINSDFYLEEKLIPVIADIRNRKRINAIIREYRPQIIFHAAAHKHVPLMEGNLEEAITNNVLGTQNLINASIENDIKKFILISSDKAVNPTNIMGTSKRMAEMVVLNAANKHNVEYSAVRFGNVLGSRGSVFGIFEKQIANGGPIKITDPNIKRYFMTIPEAVQLVLQASTLNEGGEIFVLDMGEPVKVIDLAKDMIQFSGLKFGDDIDIEITGLRPGEKMFEELFLEGEDYSITKHKKIFRAENAATWVHPNFEELVTSLIDYAKHNNNSREEMISLMREIVPEYKPIENSN